MDAPNAERRGRGHAGKDKEREDRVERGREQTEMKREATREHGSIEKKTQAAPSPRKEKQRVEENDLTCSWRGRAVTPNRFVIVQSCSERESTNNPSSVCSK